MKDHTFDLMIVYETEDTSTEDDLTLFSELIKTGECWRLQGHYGRTAQSLIDEGWISPAGEILRTA